jgi:dipeptidyl aminopeptidase/acylaminoacyl peptidase
LTAGLLLAQPAADPAATARKALDSLLGARYGELTPMFTPEMQKAFPDSEMAKLGAQIKGFGAVGKIAAPAATPAGPNTVVVIPVEFANQTINFRFIVNSKGLVAGMFAIPASTPWQRPAYSTPSSFREKAVTIGDDEWKLPGTLTLPNGTGPFPAVVLVHGSGPSDRDETVGGTKVFKDLAEGLASRGIAVLRYDKRTAVYASKIKGIRDFTINEETVDDAVRAAAFLKKQPEVNPEKVYLLGHSLGGYAAPRIAEEEKFAGVIVLAGNARPLEDLMVEQAEYLKVPASDIAGIKTQAKRIKALEPGDADAPKLLQTPPSYWLDLKDYDPVAAAKKVAAPMLFLQGDRDFQVTAKDLALWKAGLGGRKDVTFKTYPALNHLFVAGEGPSTEAEYRKPGHVAPEVVDEIAKWIKG